jgi:hypothetical protein
VTPYLTVDEAVAHCTRGLGIWEWASRGRVVDLDRAVEDATFGVEQSTKSCAHTWASVTCDGCAEAR